MNHQKYCASHSLSVGILKNVYNSYFFVFSIENSGEEEVLQQKKKI